MRCALPVCHILSHRRASTACCGKSGTTTRAIPEGQKRGKRGHSRGKRGHSSFSAGGKRGHSSFSAATPTERDDVVFYCDVAGGGGPLTHWGRSVEPGLREAGFEGEFRCFRWQTGLGALADQTTSVAYKRARTRKLAGFMMAHWRRFPGGSVHLIGLSAGSAIAVYALEQLPTSYQVDEVILLGSSLSADYDLRHALRRVRSQVHVFTSKQDRC